MRGRIKKKKKKKNTDKYYTEENKLQRWKTRVKTVEGNSAKGSLASHHFLRQSYYPSLCVPTTFICMPLIALTTSSLLLLPAWDSHFLSESIFSSPIPSLLLELKDAHQTVLDGWKDWIGLKITRQSHPILGNQQLYIHNVL